MTVVGAYEHQFLMALFDGLLADRKSELKGTLALDVGANIGNHSLYFSKYFARVIAFEPNPRAVSVLEANVKLSGANIEIAPFGLAQCDGKFDFMVNETGNLGGSGFQFAGLTKGNRIECEARSGDGFLRSLLGLPRVGLIKLDIEGAELSALKGLVRTLEEQAPIVVFESHTALGDRGCTEVFKLLRSMGYVRFFELRISVPDTETRILPRLRRLIEGEFIFWNPVVEPEDRTYPMLVALPN